MKAAASQAANVLFGKDEEYFDSTLTEEEKSIKKSFQYKMFKGSILSILPGFDKIYEWADLIKCLESLHNSLDTYKKVKLVPFHLQICKVLSQCLNSNLPTGIHRKIIEIFKTLFSHISRERLFKHFGEYSIGLFEFFPEASQQIKPLLLNLFQKFFLFPEAVPSIPFFLISLLSGMEDEGSRIYKKCFRQIEKLRLFHEPSVLKCCFKNIVMVRKVSVFTFTYLSLIHKQPSIQKFFREEKKTVLDTLEYCLSPTENDSNLKKSALDFVFQNIQIFDSNEKSKLSSQIVYLLGIREDSMVNRRVNAFLSSPHVHLKEIISGLKILFLENGYNDEKKRKKKKFESVKIDFMQIIFSLKKRLFSHKNRKSSGLLVSDKIKEDAVGREGEGDGDGGNEEEENEGEDVEEEEEEDVIIPDPTSISIETRRKQEEKEFEAFLFEIQSEILFYFISLPKKTFSEEEEEKDSLYDDLKEFTIKVFEILNSKFWNYYNQKLNLIVHEIQSITERELKNRQMMFQIHQEKEEEELLIDSISRNMLNEYIRNFKRFVLILPQKTKREQRELIDRVKKIVLQVFDLFKTELKKEESSKFFPFLKFFQFLKYLYRNILVKEEFYLGKSKKSELQQAQPQQLSSSTTTTTHLEVIHGQRDWFLNLLLIWFLDLKNRDLFDHVLYAEVSSFFLEIYKSILSFQELKTKKENEKEENEEEEKKKKKKKKKKRKEKNLYFEEFLKEFFECGMRNDSPDDFEFNFYVLNFFVDNKLLVPGIHFQEMITFLWSHLFSPNVDDLTNYMILKFFLRCIFQLSRQDLQLFRNSFTRFFLSSQKNVSLSQTTTASGYYFANQLRRERRRRRKKRRANDKEISMNQKFLIALKYWDLINFHDLSLCYSSLSSLSSLHKGGSSSLMRRRKLNIGSSSSSRSSKSNRLNKIQREEMKKNERKFLWFFHEIIFYILENEGEGVLKKAHFEHFHRFVDPLLVFLFTSSISLSHPSSPISNPMDLSTTTTRRRVKIGENKDQGEEEDEIKIIVEGEQEKKEKYFNFEMTESYLFEKKKLFYDILKKIYKKRNFMEQRIGEVITADLVYHFFPNINFRNYFSLFGFLIIQFLCHDSFLDDGESERDNNTSSPSTEEREKKEEEEENEDEEDEGEGDDDEDGDDDGEDNHLFKRDILKFLEQEFFFKSSRNQRFCFTIQPIFIQLCVNQQKIQQLREKKLDSLSDSSSHQQHRTLLNNYQNQRGINLRCLKVLLRIFKNLGKRNTKFLNQVLCSKDNLSLFLLFPKYPRPSKKKKEGEDEDYDYRNFEDSFFLEKYFNVMDLFHEFFYENFRTHQFFYSWISFLYPVRLSIVSRFLRARRKEIIFFGDEDFENVDEDGNGIDTPTSITSTEESTIHMKKELSKYEFVCINENLKSLESIIRDSFLEITNDSIYESQPGESDDDSDFEFDNFGLEDEEDGEYSEVKKKKSYLYHDDEKQKHKKRKTPQKTGLFSGLFKKKKKKKKGEDDEYHADDEPDLDPTFFPKKIRRFITRRYPSLLSLLVKLWEYFNHYVTEKFSNSEMNHLLKERIISVTKFLYILNPLIFIRQSLLFFFHNHSLVGITKNSEKRRQKKKMESNYDDDEAKKKRGSFSRDEIHKFIKRERDARRERDTMRMIFSNHHVSDLYLESSPKYEKKKSEVLEFNFNENDIYLFHLINYLKIKSKKKLFQHIIMVIKNHEEFYTNNRLSIGFIYLFCSHIQLSTEHDQVELFYEILLFLKENLFYFDYFNYSVFLKILKCFKLKYYNKFFESEKLLKIEKEILLNLFHNLFQTLLSKKDVLRPSEQKLMDSSREKRSEIQKVVFERKKKFLDVLLENFPIFLNFIFKKEIGNILPFFSNFCFKILSLPSFDKFSSNTSQLINRNYDLKKRILGILAHFNKFDEPLFIKKCKSKLTLWFYNANFFYFRRFRIHYDLLQPILNNNTKVLLNLLNLFPLKNYLFRFSFTRSKKEDLVLTIMLFKKISFYFYCQDSEDFGKHEKNENFLKIVFKNIKTALNLFQHHQKLVQIILFLLKIFLVKFKEKFLKLFFFEILFEIMKKFHIPDKSSSKFRKKQKKAIPPESPASPSSDYFHRSNNRFLKELSSFLDFFQVIRPQLFAKFQWIFWKDPDLGVTDKRFLYESLLEREIRESYPFVHYPIEEEEEKEGEGEEIKKEEKEEEEEEEEGEGEEEEEEEKKDEEDKEDKEEGEEEKEEEKEETQEVEEEEVEEEVKDLEFPTTLVEAIENDIQETRKRKDKGVSTKTPFFDSEVSFPIQNYKFLVSLDRQKWMRTMVTKRVKFLESTVVHNHILDGFTDFNKKQIEHLEEVKLRKKYTEMEGDEEFIISSHSLDSVKNSDKEEEEEENENDRNWVMIEKKKRKEEEWEEVVEQNEEKEKEEEREVEIGVIEEKEEKEEEDFLDNENDVE